MAQNISFFNTSKNKAIDPPVPCSLVLPEWYKNQSSYISATNFQRKPTEKNATSSTIKRCMPVFDALTTGYMILTPCDIWVETRAGQPFYIWSQPEIFNFHHRDQFDQYPTTQENAGKIENPWSIKTPDGYSCLFIPPLNRDNIINIFSAVVDTDSYNLPVFLPFLLKSGFEGMIPCGTPYAQVHPFKRDLWTHTVFSEGPDTEEFQASTLRKYFFDAYRKNFRAKKEYK